METRLRETTHQLMRALEAFYPFVKNAEEQISLLEGDLANLTSRKKSLEDEIAKQIKMADSLIAADKQKTKEKLALAETLLGQAQEVYFELYKAKVTKIVPPAEYGENLAEKTKVIAAKVKEAKEKAVA